MGILKWFKRIINNTDDNEIHIHLHIDGTLDNKHHTVFGDSKREIGQAKREVFKCSIESDTNVEPMLGDVKLPEIEFGEDVD